MGIAIRVFAGLLVLAHGLIHLLYLVEEPDDPKWPFKLDSWLVRGSSARRVGAVLMATIVMSFALLALAIWGVPGLVGVWHVLAIGAAALSIALLVTFWDRQLGFGVVISVLIIVLASVRPDWTDAIGA